MIWPFPGGRGQDRGNSPLGLAQEQLRRGEQIFLWNCASPAQDEFGANDFPFTSAFFRGGGGTRSNLGG